MPQFRIEDTPGSPCIDDHRDGMTMRRNDSHHNASVVCIARIVVCVGGRANGKAAINQYSIKPGHAVTFTEASACVTLMAAP